MSRGSPPWVHANCEDVATIETFVAHQATDESDLLPIRRPPWQSELPLNGRMVQDIHSTRADIQDVKLRDPPVVVRGSGRSKRGKAVPIRRPIIFVNVQRGGRDLAHVASHGADDGQSLVMDITSNWSGLRRFSFERTAATTILRIQKGEALSIRRPANIGDIALQIRYSSSFAPSNRQYEDLILRRSHVGKKRKLRAVRRPCDAVSRNDFFPSPAVTRCGFAEGSVELTT